MALVVGVQVGRADAESRELPRDAEIRASESLTGTPTCSAPTPHPEDPWPLILLLASYSHLHRLGHRPKVYVDLENSAKRTRDAFCSTPLLYQWCPLFRVY